MRLFRERKIPIIVTLGIFSLNFFLDRLAKYLAVEHLKGKPPLRFFHDLMVLIYAENTGAFLSLGAWWDIRFKSFILLIVPLCVCGAGLLYIMMREQKMSRIIIWSCILGGGVGNLADRLFNGFRVIDFMNFGIGPLRTGILNVADLSVTFGVAALLIAEILNMAGRAGKNRREGQNAKISQ